MSVAQTAHYTLEVTEEVLDAYHYGIFNIETQVMEHAGYQLGAMIVALHALEEQLESVLAIHPLSIKPTLN
jgi:hypothetical protein